LGVERGVVDPGKRQTVRNDRLPQLFVSVHDDMGGIQQRWFGQP
jgi:hypothetical protein